MVDFVQGEDKIDLSLLGISSFDNALTIAQDDGNGNVILRVQYYHYYNDDFYALRIDGITKSQLTATDFNYTNQTQGELIQGTDYRDDLFGGFGYDTIRGEGYNDRLFGDAGNDRLVGGTDSDVLYGGAGIDTAVFTGNFLEYDICVNGDEARIEHLINNGDGLDFLYDVEKVQFADRIIDLTQPPYAVFNLYLQQSKPFNQSHR